MAASVPGPLPPSGSKPSTAQAQQQEEQQAQQRRASYENARASLAAARRQFDQAVDDYHGSAARAAGQIRQVIDHDGLKDSWWDRNFGWISTVMRIVMIAVIVLAIVAIVLACPLTAGVLAAFLGLPAGALATAATVAEVVVAGLTVLQLSFDSAAALTGKGSWVSVALDVVALASLGFGRVAGAAIRGLADSGAETGEAVQAGRAGRAMMSSRGLPGIMYSVGSRSAVAEGLITLMGKGDALGEAIGTAGGARSALATAVESAEAGNGTALLTMSRAIAENMAKLEVIDTEVPGVIRVAVAHAVGRGIAGVDGAVQWGAFTSSSGYGLWSTSRGTAG